MASYFQSQKYKSGVALENRWPEGCSNLKFRMLLAW